MTAGLYVHVPFCVRKCPYCSFYSVPYRGDEAERFCEALIRELRSRLDGIGVSTLYAGGGTPTVLPARFWREFFHELRQRADTSGIVESTIETNPATVSGENLEELRRLGFDRISIGVQSFQDRILEVLERIHDGRQAVTACEEARRAGFRNVSVDLMYGVPGQTVGQWEEDLGRALEIRPEHISCYELTLEEGTPMKSSVERGDLQKPDETSCADLYFRADDLLTAEGYIHYEVSSYARGNSHASVHNCGCWRRDPCMGLGPSAHSFDGRSRRSWNHRSVRRYTEAIMAGGTAESGSETLTQEQTATERVMLGLRCCGGVDPDEIERETGVAVDRDYLRIMLERGRVSAMGSRVVPTASGKLFADGDTLNLLGGGRDN